jgi:hypothetical protein
MMIEGEQNIREVRLLTSLQARVAELEDIVDRWTANACRTKRITELEQRCQVLESEYVDDIRKFKAELAEAKHMAEMNAISLQHSKHANAELEQRGSFDLLADTYKKWTEEQGLPSVSADEQDGSTTSEFQDAYLSRFIELWDVIQEESSNG